MRNQSNTLLYRKYIAQLATAYRDREDIRIFIEMLLTSAAIFLFGVFAIRPTLITIGGLTSEIKAKQETLSTMDSKIKNLIAAQELFGKESSRLELLETAVPNEPSIASYIKQLETIAKAHSVSLFTLNTTEIPIDGASSGNSEQKITINVAFNGDYPNLLSTLKDLENIRRPLLVSTNSIALDEASDSTFQLFMSVSGDIPFWPNTNIQNP